MSDSPVSTSHLNAEHPFAGLVSFEEHDHAWFHGRDAEIEDLYRRVRTNKSTVCFGRSGLGKTSLMRAGLFPKLRRNRFLPIYIRLGYGERALNLKTQVLTATRAACTRPDSPDIESPDFREDESLWEYFHRAEFWSGFELQTPVLVFDQFEELFTLCGSDDDRYLPFVSELSDLIENRIPQADTKRLHQNHPEFSFDDQPYRVVLSLRDDFLADLETLRRKIPSIQRNRMRLLPMNGQAALEVVTQVEALSSPEIAAQIVRFVTNDKKGLALDLLAVEPALLSIFCRELNNDRLERGLAGFTQKLLDDRGDQILDDFYDDALKLYGKSEKAVRKFIEDHLLTTSGRRISVAVEDVLSADNSIEPGTIEQLIGDRLIRRFERDDVELIELTHDLLTTAIHDSGVRRRAKELTNQRIKAIGYGVVVAAVGIITALVFFRLAETAERNELIAAVMAENANALNRRLSDVQESGNLLADNTDDLLEAVVPLLADTTMSPESRKLFDQKVTAVRNLSRNFEDVSFSFSVEAARSENEEVRTNALNSIARGMNSPDEAIRVPAALQTLTSPDSSHDDFALAVSILAASDDPEALIEIKGSPVLNRLLQLLAQTDFEHGSRLYVLELLSGVSFSAWNDRKDSVFGRETLQTLLSAEANCVAGTAGCISGLDTQSGQLAQRALIVNFLAAINSETNRNRRQELYGELVRFFRNPNSGADDNLPRTAAIEEIIDRLADRQFTPAGRDIVLGYLTEGKDQPLEADWHGNPDRDLIQEMLTLLGKRENSMGRQAQEKSRVLRRKLESYGR